MPLPNEMEDLSKAELSDYEHEDEKVTEYANSFKDLERSTVEEVEKIAEERVQRAEERLRVIVEIRKALKDAYNSNEM